MSTIEFGGIFMILLYIAFIVFLVKMQIKLSRDKARWKGLVIPCIFFILSLLMVLGTASFQEKTATSLVLDEKGNVISEKVETIQDGSIGQGLLTAIPIFVIGNIPTAIFVCIYCAQRKKLTQHEELNKMNIQDL